MPRQRFDCFSSVYFPHARAYPLMEGLNPLVRFRPIVGRLFLFTFFFRFHGCSEMMISNSRFWMRSLVFSMFFCYSFHRPGKPDVRIRFSLITAYCLFFQHGDARQQWISSVPLGDRYHFKCHRFRYIILYQSCFVFVFVRPLHPSFSGFTGVQRWWSATRVFECGA